MKPDKHYQEKEKMLLKWLDNREKRIAVVKYIYGQMKINKMIKIPKNLRFSWEISGPTLYEIVSFLIYHGFIKSRAYKSGEYEVLDNFRIFVKRNIGVFQ